MFGRNRDEYTAADKKRIADLEAKKADLEAKAEAQEAEIARRDAEIEAMEDQLLTIRGETQKFQRLAREADEKRVAVEADIAAANARLATYDADVEKAAAARFAGLGGDPLPECGGNNTESSGLTGLARAQAVHKAQAAKSQTV